MRNITGHEDAKLEVMKLLCTYARSGRSTGFSLGLEGGAGIGKTTFVKEAIAKCMNRPFYTIGLGGASDAAYLTGHSFTYEGAIPGRLTECLIEGGRMDPVIYFDELDKVSCTPKGDEIINILIHLIDAVQNDRIRDRYFNGIDLDFSRAIIVFSYKRRFKN